MDYLIYFAITFTLVFLVYLLFVNLPKLKKKNYKKMGEINYLIKKFRLDPQKINYKGCANVVALINAFIISSTCVIISLFDVKIGMQLLIGFAILFALIYACYEIFGRVLVKKDWSKNV